MVQKWPMLKRRWKKKYFKSLTVIYLTAILNKMRVESLSTSLWHFYIIWSFIKFRQFEFIHTQNYMLEQLWSKFKSNSIINSKHFKTVSTLMFTVTYKRKTFSNQFCKTSFCPYISWYFEACKVNQSIWLPHL